MTNNLQVKIWKWTKDVSTDFTLTSGARTAQDLRSDADGARMVTERKNPEIVILRL